MAKNIDARLSQLQSRRSGTDRLGRLALDAQSEVLAKSFLEEDWQKRARTQPYTRYALGAMQEVGPDYTRISIETAQRVGRQLNQALTAAGFSIDFRLQGSVPLNVHIRGVSDVDLLNLDNNFFTYCDGWSTEPPWPVHGQPFDQHVRGHAIVPPQEIRASSKRQVSGYDS